MWGMAEKGNDKNKNCFSVKFCKFVKTFYFCTCGAVAQETARNKGFRLSNMVHTRIFQRGLVFILLIIFGLSGTGLSAQNISVKSFRLLETDLTANTAGTLKKDQNNETTALIKVVTTETGFVFDGGMLGIVGTTQRAGEIWVYVPPKSRKITILHPQLGVLRDYFYPIPIEAGRTYEMVLATGRVTTVVQESAGGQYLVMKVSPPTPR